MDIHKIINQIKFLNFLNLKNLNHKKKLKLQMKTGPKIKSRGKDKTKEIFVRYNMTENSIGLKQIALGLS